MDNSVKVGQIRRDTDDDELVRVERDGDDFVLVVISGGYYKKGKRYTGFDENQILKTWEVIDETYRVKETLKRYGVE